MLHIAHAVELVLHLGGQHFEGGRGGHGGDNASSIVIAPAALAGAGGQLTGRSQGIDRLQPGNVGVEAHHIGGGDHAPVVGLSQTHQVGKLARALYFSHQHRWDGVAHGHVLALEGEQGTGDRKGHHLAHVVGQHLGRLLLQGFEQAAFFFEAFFELGVFGQQVFVKGGQLGLLVGDRPL